MRSLRLRTGSALFGKLMKRNERLRGEEGVRVRWVLKEDRATGRARDGEIAETEGGLEGPYGDERAEQVPRTVSAAQASEARGAFLLRAVGAPSRSGRCGPALRGSARQSGKGRTRVGEPTFELERKWSRGIEGGFAEVNVGGMQYCHESAPRQSAIRSLRWNPADINRPNFTQTSRIPKRRIPAGAAINDAHRLGFVSDAGGEGGWKRRGGAAETRNKGMGRETRWAGRPGVR